MKKKRIVIFLIALNLIILSIFNFNIKTYADEQISVTAEASSSMEQGSSAYCYIKISSLENVSSINISVYYDSNKIEILNTYNNVSSVLYDSSINNDNVNYSYIFDGNGENAETTLFYFYYKIKDDAELGNTYFDIIITDALDSSLDELNVKGSRYNINILEKKVSKSCYVYNNTNSINTQIGQDFEIKYYFSTYEIASGSMNITYDCDLFELKNYTFGNFFEGKIKDINTNLNGSVYISFLGTEYTYSTDIITLTFSPKKNITEQSVISNLITDLYDNDLNNIICTSTNISVNIIKDESYIEDAPRMYLNASMQNNNSQCLLTVKLDEAAKLGAGDFVINFDTDYLAYNSANKILSATYFNVNDKKVDEGILKFSIISLENIINETDVLGVLFDINPICSNQFVDFDITASGLADSLTNPIMLNMVGLNYELVSNGHQYGDWSVTTSPTLESAGLLTKVCQNDNTHVETCELPILNNVDYTYNVETNPTCTTQGKDSYTITVDNQTFKFEVMVEKLGHSWGNPTYVWNNDEVTATRICGNDNSHAESEAVKGTYVKDSDATCTLNEKGHYEASFINEAFVKQESAQFEVANSALGHKLAEAVRENEIAPTCTTDGSYDEVVYCSVCKTELSRSHKTIGALGHSWEAPTYVWNGDEVTATRVCVHNNNHVETETVKGTYAKDYDATCTENEKGHYEASFNNVAFTKQSSAQFEIKNSSLGHAWGNPTYAWNGDEVTASRVCAHNNNHIETETVDGTYVKDSDATCTLNEKGHYEASFANTAFEAQSSAQFEIANSALGHKPSEAVRENEVAPTCTTDGSYDEVIYCSVCKAELSREHKAINALGHSWGNPTYSWNGDEVTATRVCNNNQNHIETEKVKGTYAKDNDATCTENEKGHYEASFNNSAFTKQSSVQFEIENSSLGHAWGNPTYVWNNDEVTATRICGNDNSHAESEAVKGTYVKDSDATCTENEKGHYEASFTNKAFVKQESAQFEVANSALGHSWSNPTYAWNNDEVTATRVCAHNNNHIETETVKGTYLKDSGATCTENEKGHYEASFNNSAFVKQESAQFEIANSALGHSWCNPTYVWNNDEVTATRVCAHNQNHIETETVKGTYVKDSDATCTLNEKGHYEASFNNTAFIKQSSAQFEVPNSALGHKPSKTVRENEVAPTCTTDGSYDEVIYCSVCKAELSRGHKTIDAIGHSWCNPTYTWNGDEATATRICNHDQNHIETETVKGTYVKDSNATCTENEKGHYAASFTNISFEAQSSVQFEIANSTLGHSWGNPTYEWNGDEATATRICANDQNHVETEAVKGTYVKDSGATCTENEKGHYEASFSNSAFTKQESAQFELANSALGHKPAEAVRENEVAPTCTTDGSYDEVVYCSVCKTELSRSHKHIDATGHSWCNPTYTWNGDEATATRICANDQNHVETEAVKGTYVKDVDATCTENEKGHYEASFSNSAFTKQESAQFEVANSVLGHSWCNPTYIWSGDEVAATRICANDQSHIETETVNGTYVKDSDAKCTLNEKGHYEATFTNEAFESQSSAQFEVANSALGHKPADAVRENEIAPTCTTDGSYDEVVYCSVCKAELSRSHKHIDAIGHSWGNPTYEWNGDEVTATRVCSHDQNHIETKTVKGTYVKDSEATCAENEKGHYEASFNNSAFTKQESAQFEIANSILGHSWGTTTYEWDNDEVTATRICRNDKTHIETETVKGTYVKDSDATCTENEKGHYEASFTNKAFVKQESAQFEVANSALGHSWSNPTYAWNNDEVTATRICAHNQNHIETETVNGTYVKDSVATCTLNERGHYEASFTNGAFTKQASAQFEVANSILGHSWGNPTYEWNGDEATATRICAHNQNHIETEAIEGTYVKDSDATCTENEKGHYEASFANISFESQSSAQFEVANSALGHHLSHKEAKSATETEDGNIEYWYCDRCEKYFADENGLEEITQSVIIPALGHQHNYQFTEFIWSNDNLTAMAKYVCSKNDSHVEFYEATMSHNEKSAANCTEAQVITYTATYDGHNESKDVEGEVALGHSWGNSTYEWNDDEVTATRICSHNQSHIETETVKGTYVKDSDATCTLNEKGHYEASFNNTAFIKQSSAQFEVPNSALGHKPAEAVRENGVAPTCTTNGSYDEVVYCSVCKAELSREHKTINALGHAWGNPTYTWNGDEVTATRICSHDQSHIETETIKGTYIKDSDATCTLNEKGHYEASFTNEAFIKQESNQFEVANSALGHKPAEAVRESEVAPTCTANGSYDEVIYCSVCKVELSREHKTINALDHSWGTPEYVWNNDKVTATRVCAHNQNHIEAETVIGTYVKDSAATCILNEKGHYEASFANSVFEAQASAQFEIANSVLGHSWGNPTYTWNNDVVTATRICANDQNHVETETVKGTYVKNSAATCTLNEKGHYEATFTNTAFTKQESSQFEINNTALGHKPAEAVRENEVAPTCTIDGSYDEVIYCSACKSELSREHKSINALGHSWGTPEYVWNNDKVTATRVCAHNQNHIEVETVIGIYVKDSDATCTLNEKGHNEASFANTEFEAQVSAQFEMANSALGHSWGNPTYVWNGDEVTATRICSNDNNHIETETVKGTYIKDSDATCTLNEKGHYEAIFTNNIFVKQSSAQFEVANSALGHKPAEAIRENEVAPTCTIDGSYDEVVYCSVCKAELSREHKTINALGHSWDNPTYVWKNDKVTATRICAHNQNHIEAETVTGTYVKDIDATCTLNEKGHYEATFANMSFETQGSAHFEVENSALGHHMTHTEAKPATETEDGNIEYWYCDRCEKYYADESGAEEITQSVIIPAQGHQHDYQFTEFIWSSDNLTAKAKYVCSKNASHFELYDATMNHNEKSAANCTEAQIITYTATYDGHSESKDVEGEAAFGHIWGNTTYSWNGDEVTATRICANDNNHDETEVVKATYVKDSEATCTVNEKGHYEASFNNTAFTKQASAQFEVANSVLGHSWGNPTYTWNGDEVTATRACANNQSHIETETVKGTYVKDSAATCTLNEKGHYEASFTNAAFEAQESAQVEIANSALGHKPAEAVRENEIAPTCTINGSYDEVIYCSVCKTELSRGHKTINALGHSWGNPTYSWNGDEVTATRICANDQSHIETETVKGTYVKDSEATCTLNEKGHYEASFTSEAFTKQESAQFAVENTALGHSWGNPTYTWNGDEVTATRVCANDQNHIETETVKGTYVKDSDATCTLNEKGHYEASFTNVAFTKQESTQFEVTDSALGHKPSEAVRENEIAPTCTTAGSYDEVVYCSVCKTELSRVHKTINALGHSWGNPTYTWNGDEVTATRICGNDQSHIESETIKGTYVKDADATCTLNEKGHYEASFTNTAFEPQTSAQFEITDSTLNHKPAEAVRENEVVPTCTTAGSYDEVVYCSVCKAELSRENKAINALGHSYGAWVTTKEATYKETGSEHRICSVCGYEETREIPKLDSSSLFINVVNSINSSNESLESLYDKLAQCYEYYQYIDDKATVSTYYEAYQSALAQYQNIVNSINSEYNTANTIEKNYFIAIISAFSLLSFAVFISMKGKWW